MPVMLLIIGIFVLWLHYEKSKSTRIDQQNTEAFWNAERDANQTRKKDLSNLDYISIPIEALPIQESTDQVLLDFQEKIISLSKLSIVNLTGLSNTDLKLQYGAPNLTTLSEYDLNYTHLVRTLNTWANYLVELGQKDKAKMVLEYAISCNSDIKQTYVTLAQIYIEEKNPRNITNLIDTADSLRSLSKVPIKNSLEELLHQSSIG